MNVTLDLFYLILYLVCYLAMTFIAFYFTRKYFKERGERERADLQLVNLYKDKMHAEGKCKRLLKDFNELQEQYAELEAARDRYKEEAACANEIQRKYDELCTESRDKLSVLWYNLDTLQDLGILDKNFNIPDFLVKCESLKKITPWEEIELLKERVNANFEPEELCDESEQSREPASEDKVADVCKEFCEKLDEAVGELELDIDKLVDECIKELMEGVE